MGQPRQSQSNDEKNTGKKQGGKQQNADSDKTSSRTTGTYQQQQKQDTGRSPQDGGEGDSPRAGIGRDADNPSQSANQENRGGSTGKDEH